MAENVLGRNIRPSGADQIDARLTVVTYEFLDSNALFCANRFQRAQGLDTEFRGDARIRQICVQQHRTQSGGSKRSAAPRAGKFPDWRAECVVRSFPANGQRS